MMIADVEIVDRCARLIREADGILITAGAGMGVDSGLPDFRGAGGFWKHYPALAAAGLQFEAIANPRHFNTDPRLAWGFYGHRLNLYRATQPHDGFRLLREIGERMPARYFVYTSNVDGHFQDAGFDPDRLAECHGSIHHLQCQANCSQDIWPASPEALVIDEGCCRLLSDIPSCPRCGGIARPNILMFGDWDWLSARSDSQEQGLHAWLRQVERPLVIEVGAGTNIPTARLLGERVHGPLIRINPTESQLPHGKGVSIAAGGLAALRAIDSCLV